MARLGFSIKARTRTHIMHTHTPKTCFHKKHRWSNRRLHCPFKSRSLVPSNPNEHFFCYAPWPIVMYVPLVRLVKLKQKVSSLFFLDSWLCFSKIFVCLPNYRKWRPSKIDLVCLQVPIIRWSFRNQVGRAEGWACTSRRTLGYHSQDI